MRAARGKAALRHERGSVQQLRGLFQQRVAGDDALLRLARLRFEQAGLGAELYAHHMSSLERELAFVPDGYGLPTVHLDRALNLLRDEDCARVAAFAQRFAGRVAGFVVHDKRDMAEHTAELVNALRRLDAEIAGCGAMVFLEYAAGHQLEWFADVGASVSDLANISMCIDTGHVGIHGAHRGLGHSHPDVGFGRLQADPDLLASHIDDVQRTAADALPAVLDLTQTLSRNGKAVHFHLHDGHPLIAGLSDHFSFLTRVPLPFEYEGRRSVDTMYGPDGLRTIVDTALAASPQAPPSFTLEIHQAEGRRPLDDAAELFGQWSDLTNAERMNHWLAVLAENARLL